MYLDKRHKKRSYVKQGWFNTRTNVTHSETNVGAMFTNDDKSRTYVLTQ